MRKNIRLLFARTAEILSSARRAAMTLLLMMLTTMTAWADGIATLAQDGNEWYVNMPKTGTNTLTITAEDITAGKGTFKVYDDGGKSGQYSASCNGNLVLIAPTGYLLQLSGSVTTDDAKDNMTVYNGSTTSSTKLIDAVYGTTNINTSSTSNFMTLNFITNAVFQGVGFDLTVTLVVAPTTDYNVTINTAEGGSVTASPTSAKINEAITLTATPGNEYMLSGISVKDADNNDVVVTWDGMFINTATFTMPGSDVTVTPTFTNDLTNLSVNMPKTGEKDVIIPSYVQSFKVYDDGGKDGNYSQNCTGTLVLTAPEGYVLQLSGSVTLDYNNEKLTVYNGTKANDDKLIDAFSCSESNTKTDIPMATSKGNVMTIYFETNNFYEYAGLDLTVTVVSTSTDYTINGLGSATGGSISASVGGENATTAKANDVVTLTATPENGYLLSGISVTDASSNPVAVTGGKWYDNTATFTMPGSVATVTPTFTDDMTDLSVNMPVTEDQIVEIPAGVESFKVYDDGGKDNVHSQNCTGTLVLTAPENHLLRLSGKITTDAYDYLTVYDGSKENGSKLLNEVRSTSGGTETGIKPVTSKGNVMTLYFYTNNFYEEAGLDLTVTVVNPNTEYNVNVINPAEGGSVTASPTSAKVNETVTLTATPASGYLLSGISVTDAGSNPVAVTWDGPFSNTATFTMPGSNVTITPTFTNTLTADGGLYINMPATSNKELTIPSGVQSFKVYDNGGSNGDYSINCDGYLTLTAPTGYVLQLSGGITAEGSDKLTVYNGSTTNSTKLIDAMGGIGSTKKDIEPVTSTDNVMMINFKSDYSMNYAGLDLTVTLIKQTKDIANCAVTVPDQVVSPYGYSFNDIQAKFNYANDNIGQDYAAACIEDIGAVVMDGSKTLVFGTDYVFGTVAGKTGNEASQVGDEYTVEIKGKGDYAGTTTASFKIKNPGGAWGDLTWSLASGTLTISGVGTMNTATTYNGYGFPWVNYRSQINSVVIGEGVTSIADKAFGETHTQEKYENVIAITLPSTLTSIGANAFNGCTNSSLNITIPTRVTSVGADAFICVAKVTATLSDPVDDNTNNNTALIARLFEAMTADITYKRTFTKNVASTICLPFAVSQQKAAEVGTFYDFTSVNGDWTEVTMTEVNTSLTANTPYLFKSAATGEQTFSGTATNGATAGTKTVGEWTFTGTYAQKRWDANNNSERHIFGFSTGQGYGSTDATITTAGVFIRLTTGGINPFRAYLEYTGSLQARTRGEGGLPETMTVRLVNANGEIQGIGEIRLSTGEVTFDSRAWYDLNGRRLEGKPSEKGIYINGGRKVVIK